MADLDDREFQKTNTKLYIGNLPGHFQGADQKERKEAATQYVANLCQRYGQYTEIIVSLEKRFAFVTFASKEAAQYALYQLADSNAGGNILHVSWAKPTKEQLAARDARRAKEREETDKPKEKPADGQQPQQGQPQQGQPQQGQPQQGQPQQGQPQQGQPQQGQQTKQGNAAKQAAKAELKPVVEEKPEPVRFSTQQRVAVPKQKPVQQQPVAVPPQPKKTNKPAPKQTPTPQQRFRVTVQNETTPGLPTVVLSISFDEWSKYICPLISNNSNPHVTQ